MDAREQAEGERRVKAELIEPLQRLGLEDPEGPARRRLRDLRAALLRNMAPRLDLRDRSPTRSSTGRGRCRSPRAMAHRCSARSSLRPLAVRRSRSSGRPSCCASCARIGSGRGHGW